ncbi:unnamed protein product [Prunus armeniaca]
MAQVFSRQFSVKWWDKFKVDRIAEYVYRDFPQIADPPKPKPSSSNGTSQSSLQVEGSKSELQEIARQLIIQASQMEDDDDDASPNSQSSTSQPQLPPNQMSPSQKMLWVDSQDPYDLNSD